MAQSLIADPAIVDAREQQASEASSTAITALRPQILAGLFKPSTNSPHAFALRRTRAQVQILTDHAKEIVEFMGVQGDEKSVVVELGAGSLKKTSHILLALANTVAEPTSAAEAPITYYALDLERKELLRTLGVVSSTIGSTLAGRVATKGMWGTYDGGLAFIRTEGLAKGTTAPEDGEDRITQRCGDANMKDLLPIFTTTPSQTPTPRPEHAPLHILFLGSSIGNFSRPDAVDFLNSLPLRPGSGDTLLLGLDHRNDGSTIETAYDDPAGWIRKFEYNGLRVAERVLQGRGDEVDRDYGEILMKDGWVLEEKWNEVEVWNLITLKMIPPSMLHVKPIDLRHKCLFYLGHIPTFCDIHLTRVLRRMGKKEEGHTEPEYFKDIFERGIDPDVDDPSVIHPHSEVPDKDEDWPALGEVLAFRDRVRARLIRVYEEYGVEREGESTVRDFSRAMARVLWMTWEHEAFHAETLLYMLIQKAGDVDGTIPPPGFAKPQWGTLQKLPELSQPLPASTVTMEAGTEISLGHDDVEAEDPFDQLNSPTHEFGWDTEHPKRSVKLREKAVRVETRPVLNEEFYEFWIKERKAGGHDLPGLWVVDLEGDVKVRTLYGPVSMSVAGNWPFIGAYDDLAAFAKWKGGRLPTEVELRTYMDRYEGSEESNIGFKNWHPVPPQVPDVENGVRGHNGGVWEWAETLFDEYPGFEKSALYPGFSSDFFDGKHHVALGGSYALVPRLAQRRTVRNWFQHNYPYAFVGGRVVYDISKLES
ncbi:hypothetical protein FRC04_005731 [Tulasnella sp. 424]|nr:hypothetical protein FRC04_005731 [Tulasnella sp. 424]KAG8977523.1 hypothetical protein FRC05_001381 [Tulasnella sp. 425]